MKCEFFDQKQTLALLKTLVHPYRPVTLRSCPQNNSILIPPLHFLPLLFDIYIFLLALLVRPLLFIDEGHSTTEVGLRNHGVQFTIRGTTK